MFIRTPPLSKADNDFGSSFMLPVMDISVFLAERNA